MKSSFHTDTTPSPKKELPRISGSEAVMRSFLAEGVETIFGYPGGAIIPVYNALYDYRDKINHILVYNFVESIDGCAAKLARAIPEARITVAHGKMDKDHLEDIWGEMLRGEIDILVCSTIIETGVDIPNANTIIVNQAQMAEALKEHLTEEEADVYKRGRNAKTVSHAKNAGIGQYHKATGFEALIGYLYLRGEEERILELIKLVLPR